jgi:hypothetical protein
MDIQYGFINDDNRLISTAIIQEGDLETFERIKNEFNAVDGYPIPEEHLFFIHDLTLVSWNGSRFIPDKTFASFVWNDENNKWVPPIPFPSDDKVYIWDEETISWLESPEV